MSLINKALKEEQRRRTMSSGPNAPMMAMAARRRHERAHLLLLGFTIAGVALAACITLVIYFGSRFLESASFASNDVAAEPVMTAASGPTDTDGLADSIQAPITGDDGAPPPAQPAEAEVASNAAPSIETAAEPAAEPEMSAVTAARIKAQEVVDGFSIQGIRKAGKATRVFMNGKIQKLGDVVDLETGIVLIGFTEDELVFEDSQGYRYTKLL